MRRSGGRAGIDQQQAVLGVEYRQSDAQRGQCGRGLCQRGFSLGPRRDLVCRFHGGDDVAAIRGGRIEQIEIASGEASAAQESWPAVVGRHDRPDLGVRVAGPIDAAQGRGAYCLDHRRSRGKGIGGQGERFAEGLVHHDDAQIRIDHPHADRDGVEHGLMRDREQIAHVGGVSIGACGSVR
jgi:hypothetical protein